jgi:broad specificity phosphatase PhoE
MFKTDTPPMFVWYNNFMSVNITYFVHGTTTDNEENKSSGWNDAKLSELGIQQSKELEKLTADKKFDAVFTSDLSRAVDSAKLSWGDLYPTFPDERLRECNYGDLNGEDSEIVEPMQEKSITKPMPNGESYEDVKNRIKDFLDFLKKYYDGKHIAIVAHKAPQLALDVIIKDMSWDEAFAKDWRNTKSWQPGWEYVLK